MSDNKGQNRYENGKVYKLIDQESEYFYIGSTCDTLSKRLCRHKAVAKTKPNIKVYKVFNDIGWDNIKIVLIEEHCLENKEQLLREENKIIMMYKDDEKCLNSLFAWVGLEHKEYCKKYYQDNILRLKEKSNEYRQEHKEEKNQYLRQYRQDNKEKLREFEKARYIKRRDAELERMAQKYTCECGRIITVGNKSIHEKMKIHKRFILEKETAKTI